MNIFDTYSDLPEHVKGNIVVIGNFDGVHRGHQTLLNEAKDMAEAAHKKLVVLTFEPHPKQVFQPSAPPFRLTNKKTKIEALIKHGADFVVAVEFTHEFSQKSAQDFIDDVLIHGLGATHILVGDDFTFGFNRGGTVEILHADNRFQVTALEQVKTDKNAIYGSSLIRNALKRADLETVKNHLGHYWCTQATVIHGNKRGRTIGYPTANMKLDDQGDFIHPAYGVYAVRARSKNLDWHMGVANFGIRPMFTVPEPLLEVHLFDFDGDLYGQILDVEWVAYLREEMTFESLDDLITQMNQDSSKAKEILTQI